MDKDKLFEKFINMFRPDPHDDLSPTENSLSKGDPKPPLESSNPFKFEN